MPIGANENIAAMARRTAAFAPQIRQGEVAETGQKRRRLEAFMVATLLAP